MGSGSNADSGGLGLARQAAVIDHDAAILHDLDTRSR
jgi:hypothetical protein